MYILFIKNVAATLRRGALTQQQRGECSMSEKHRSGIPRM